MTELYSGTPGSGKSLHSAYRLIEQIEKGKTVIANFPINMNYFNFYTYFSAFSAHWERIMLIPVAKGKKCGIIY